MTDFVPEFFLVEADYQAFVEDASTDSDYDMEAVPVSGNVLFTPEIKAGDVVAATSASPRPIGFVPASISAVIHEGRLKLRSADDSGASGGPGFVPVKLLCDSPGLGLSAPLQYKVTFSNITFASGRRGSITGFNFVAPSSGDVTVNLISVGRVPSQSGVGIVRLAPTGVRVDGEDIVFTAGGVDIDDPIPASIFVGASGATGATGATGASGAIGARILGKVANHAALPGSPAQFDAYVNIEDGLLYVYNGSWPSSGNGVPWLGPAGTSFTQLIGNGSATSIAVTHGLGTRGVAVSVFDAATWAEVECDVVATDNNTVTLTFATAPATNAMSVAVITGGTGPTGATGASGVPGMPRVESLRTIFRDIADGAIPATGGEGVDVVIDGDVTPVIEDGLFQSPDLTGTEPYRATYWSQLMPGVKHVGATFKFSSGTGTIAAGLLIWEYPIPTPYEVPNSPMHLAITPTSWELAVWTGGTESSTGSFTSIGSGSISLATDWNPAVAGSGTLHRCEVWISGNTATIALPNGTITTVTHAQIAAVPGNVAGWEHYRAAGTAGFCGFQEIWASTDVEQVSVASRQNLLSKTLTTPRIATALLDANGKTALAVDATTSAVNHTRIVNAPTGVPPVILPEGDDTHISLQLRPKGTSGSVTVQDANAKNIIGFIRGHSSAVNYWALYNSGAGGDLPVYAQGTDTNISFDFVPKGTGLFKVGGNRVGVKVAVPASATATGVVGQWAADSSWLYVCTATNTWVRAALASW